MKNRLPQSLKPAIILEIMALGFLLHRLSGLGYYTQISIVILFLILGVAWMGSTYRFECEGCGYIAEVSGGPDRGWKSKTITVFCARCRTLKDHGVATWNASSREWIESPDSKKCGQCGGSLVEWTAINGKCPFCGMKMIGRGLILNWD